VDAVFTPGHGELYPEGFQTSVRVGGLTDILEGERRPGHFDGVTTVVAKLLSIVGPCRAVFGRKDYQQLAVVRKMVSDLNMQVCIAEHPIVRELDGLALSSRNRYLSPEERQRALCLSQGIRAARDLWAKGERETVLLEEAAMVPVRAGADRVDYVTVRDALTLERVPSFSDSEPVLLLAAFVGKTRLIDNSVLCAADYS
jgi:pantoate--beta-alanine ligase